MDSPSPPDGVCQSQVAPAHGGHRLSRENHRTPLHPDGGFGQGPWEGAEQISGSLSRKSPHSQSPVWGDYILDFGTCRVLKPSPQPKSEHPTILSPNTSPTVTLSNYESSSFRVIPQHRTPNCGHMLGFNQGDTGRARAGWGPKHVSLPTATNRGQRRWEGGRG